MAAMCFMFRFDRRVNTTPAAADAYIDTAAYQPVLITTVMARKIPFVVRTLLGTNVPGLGFTVTYAPQSDGGVVPRLLKSLNRVQDPRAVLLSPGDHSGCAEPRVREDACDLEESWERLRRVEEQLDYHDQSGPER